MSKCFAGNLFRLDEAKKTAAASSDSRRPVIKTYAPSFTNRFAVASPMPVLPPVTSATFLSSLPIYFSFARQSLLAIIMQVTCHRLTIIMQVTSAGFRSNGNCVCAEISTCCRLAVTVFRHHTLHSKQSIIFRTLRSLRRVRRRLWFGPCAADFKDQICVWTAFVLYPHAVGPPDLLRGNRDIRILQIGRVHHDVWVDMTSNIVAALVVPYLVGREHVYNACLLRAVKATGSIVFVNSFLDFAGIDSLRQQLATFQSSL